MASTRSTAPNRRAARTNGASTSRQTLAALTRRAARMQIAAGTATARTLLAWAQAADHYAQVVGDELLRRVDGETDSTELLVRVNAATGTHLCELSALPRTAADHFDARLGWRVVRHLGGTE
jgi:hypothetical protein